MSEDEAIREMLPIEGWFSEDEARLLYRSASAAARGNPWPIVEIGSYKGRSTVVLGFVVRDHCLTTPVVAIDPHAGTLTGREVPSTWDTFTKNLEKVGLLGRHVFPIRKAAQDVDWEGPIAFLFLDGLHDAHNVALDYAKYSEFVQVGGLIAFHDYSNPDFPGVRHVVDGLLLSGRLSFHAKAQPSRPENTLIVTKKCPTLSIVIPTCGRLSLTRTLESVASTGARNCDEVIVVGDGRQAEAERQVREFLSKSKPGFRVSYHEYGPTNMVGSAQRMLAMGKATGTHLAFVDDDDVYLPGALDAVREEILKAPQRPLVFKERSCVARHSWGVVWKDKAVRCGNVGTQGIVVPNNPNRLGHWPNERTADYTFLRTTVDLYPNRDADVVWIDRIIAELH